MIIAVNGRLVNEHEAVISAYDHGFLYGIGLFETFRTYGGKPILLAEHVKRLASGCEELGIRLSLEQSLLSQWIAALLEANGLSDAYFRLSISAGAEALGLPTGPYEQPTVILYVKELPPIAPSLYETGRALQLLRLRRSSPETSMRLKSFQYMNNILGKRELAAYPWAGAAEGLFLDQAGNLAEGIVSNLFFCENDAVYTPSLDTGILPGITRACVLALLKQQGIPVHEGLYGWERLMTADEIFMTNSIQEMVPITSLYDTNGHLTTVRTGAAGMLTRQLLQAYRDLAGRRSDKEGDKQ